MISHIFAPYRKVFHKTSTRNRKINQKMQKYLFKLLGLLTDQIFSLEISLLIDTWSLVGLLHLCISWTLIISFIYNDCDGNLWIYSYYSCFYIIYIYKNLKHAPSLWIIKPLYILTWYFALLKLYNSHSLKKIFMRINW